MLGLVLLTPSGMDLVIASGCLTIHTQLPVGYDSKAVVKSQCSLMLSYGFIRTYNFHKYFKEKIILTFL